MNNHNPNRRKNKGEIPPATCKAFYEELWRTAVAKENGGVEPDNVEREFSPVVFKYPKGKGSVLSHLLDHPIPVNEKISSPFYFSKRYDEALRGNTVVFDSVLLHNCLLYMGCTLTEDEEKIPSTSDKAKILLSKFEAKQVAKDLKNEKPVIEKPEIIDAKPPERSFLLPSGRRIKATYKADYVPDPDFYNKKTYERLLKKRKDLTKIYLWYGTTAIGCAAYCGYFLWYIFKNADPVGNWWWFGIAALIIFRVFLIYFSKDEYQYSEKRKTDLAIMKLEHYFSSGEYIDDDEYFTPMH
jgi:hypothetical protein